MKKELIPTIIGVSLPILMVLGVFAYVFMVQNIPLPNQNFVFSAKAWDECSEYVHKITLQPNGTLQKNKDLEVARDEQYDPCYGKVVVQKETPDMYVYDFKTETIKKVSLEDLSKNTIKSGMSDEGYAVSFSRDFRYYGPVDMFVGTAPTELYLKKGDRVKKLNTDSFPNLTEEYNFSIIGWIK